MNSRGMVRVGMRRAVVMAAGVALVLGACTPEEGPSPTAEPTSSSASPSESGESTEEPTDERPEVEAPERPVEMGEESVEGAIAAAEYFIGLFPYIFATGDFADWDAMTDERCRFCVNSREGAADLHADDGYAIGGEIEVTSRDGDGPFDDDLADAVYIVELGLEISEMEEITGDGQRSTAPAESYTNYRFALYWVDGSWRVLDAWSDEANP